jgi:hypothetical protein
MGRLDLEAIEVAVRSAVHQAGAAALGELLRYAAPTVDQRTIPCGCGQQAHYRELRSKPVLTVLGEVEVSRPYYSCPHCHTGQFPADVELGIENSEVSPGVRRMQAVVGQEAPFEHGREQMKLLAGLEVTTKAVERTAEAIGENIATHEQKEIQRAMQLDLPIVIGEPSWGASSPRPPGTRKATRSAIRIPPRILAPLAGGQQGWLESRFWAMRVQPSHAFHEGEPPHRRYGCWWNGRNPRKRRSSTSSAIYPNTALCAASCG